MQSPPRKGKLAAALRCTHSEQLNKLQTKHQQESDLLEDIKNFAKQRATIEKNYGESLLKLATSYLQKKIPSITDVKTADGKERKSVYTVWRMILDENEKLGKARLAATEVFQQQIFESAKSVKLQKMQVSRKCLDQLQKIHEDLQLSVRELDKLKKTYMDEEHVAHDAREKAHEAEEKLKRKKGHFFQSLTSLQKNSAKFSSKKEACDIRSTSARNDYLLCLASTNAHQARYHDVELPEIMKMMDTDVYEKVAEYFQLLSQTELFTCAATQTSYTKIKEVADLITHQHNVQCYLHDWTALRDKIQYQYEPCNEDKIDSISSEHNSGHNLSKEAKRCATKIVKETKAIRSYHKQLKTLLNQSAAAGQKDETTGGEAAVQAGAQQDIEQKIEELRLNIRRAEISKLKAEARIEALREAGVNVDEWLTDVEALGPLDLAGGSLSRACSTLSVKTDISGNVDDGSSEFYDSDYNDDISDTSATGGSRPAAPSAAHQESDEMSEPRDTTSLTGSAGGGQAAGEMDGDTTSMGFTPLRCVAVYSYTAQNADELSIIEQEVLEVVGEGDGDGWVKARNSQGVEGFVPQSYVDVEGGEAIPNSIYPAPTSFSSVDYSMPEWGDDEPTAEEPEPEPEAAAEEDGTQKQEPDVVAQNHVEAEEEDEDAAAVPDLPEELAMSWCQAMYDYEAACPEELTFAEGQVIRVLRKHVHNVDDGWWEGRVDGQTGIFPSLVVEELRSNGDPLSPEDLASPPGSAPPTFAPPPMPQFLSAAAQVIITQPTPETENPDSEAEEEMEKHAAYNYSAPDFEMELNEAQQEQYQTQFSMTDSNANETGAETSSAIPDVIASLPPDVMTEETETEVEAEGVPDAQETTVTPPEAEEEQLPERQEEEVTTETREASEDIQPEEATATEVSEEPEAMEVAGASQDDNDSGRTEEESPETKTCTDGEPDILPPPPASQYAEHTG